MVMFSFINFFRRDCFAVPPMASACFKDRATLVGSEPKTHPP